eukprot:350242-Chlamydomonas_euryale.AAC.7
MVYECPCWPPEEICHHRSRVLPGLPGADPPPHTTSTASAVADTPNPPAGTPDKPCTPQSPPTAPPHDPCGSLLLATQEYIDIECEDAVEVAVSSLPDAGTVYSISVPVARVRTRPQQARRGAATAAEPARRGASLDINAELELERWGTSAAVPLAPRSRWASTVAAGGAPVDPPLTPSPEPAGGSCFGARSALPEYHQ